MVYLGPSGLGAPLVDITRGDALPLALADYTVPSGALVPGFESGIPDIKFMFSVILRLLAFYLKFSRPLVVFAVLVGSAVRFHQCRSDWPD